LLSICGAGYLAAAVHKSIQFNRVVVAHPEVVLPILLQRCKMRNVVPLWPVLGSQRIAKNKFKEIVMAGVLVIVVLVLLIVFLAKRV
jgi:hypothetical protein